MIHITGDTADELAGLQILLEAGMINNDEDIKLHITYSLSSDNFLLVNQYNHIVGETEGKKE